MLTYGYFVTLILFYLNYGITSSDTNIFKTRYLGCYVEPGHHKRRLLEHMYKWNQVTPDRCIMYCGSQNYTYAGMQFRNECFCSNGAKIRLHTPTNESDCNMSCAGDQRYICGGFYRISTYQILGEWKSAFFASMDSYGGYIYEDALIFTEHVHVLEDCVSLCHSNKKCNAFGFGKINGSCHGYLIPINFQLLGGNKSAAIDEKIYIFDST